MYCIGHSLQSYVLHVHVCVVLVHFFTSIKKVDCNLQLMEKCCVNV